MKELFSIRDNLANKISYYHLLLLMASLPFDRFYSHLILISLIVHTLIHFKKQPAGRVFSWRTAALVSVFLVTVLSTFYSGYPGLAYVEWGRQLPVLLFPLVFYYIPLDLKKYRNVLLLAFSLLCTATVAYLYLDALMAIRFYGMPAGALFSSHFTNHNFSSPIDMHATFFSMQIAVALIFLLSVVIKERHSLYRLYLIGCMLLLSAGLVQLSSKSVCFCLLAVIILAVPWFLLHKGRRLKYTLTAACLLLLPVLVILKLHTFRERYVNELEFDLSDAAAGESADPRMARWAAVTELITASPVTGYGAGSETPLLQKIFFEKKFYSSYIHRLNSHNEYLSLLLKSGIPGLLMYLVTLGFGFRIAFQRKDLLLFLFLSLIVFVSGGENLLDVDKGIIFYAFFFSFFLFSSDGTIINPVSSGKDKLSDY